ncbi:MAG TPA: glycosyltransferase family 4 protein [Acetobacteraceae bacterium]|nr:glycosyltransferase family 4 protein [Acetobacteraceae bacterium]
MSPSGAPGDPRPLVAMVLPGGEGFSPAVVGAIGLIVHRLAGVAGPFRSVVLGQAGPAAPFADRAFVPVQAWPLPRLGARARYPGAVLRVLRRLRPALVEVHNRPVIALMLARRLPGTKVVLVLHNDPQSMRSAHTTAERSRLLRRLAGVVAVSEWVRGRLLDGVAGPSPIPVEVLPNCIDLAALPPGLPAAAREKVILFAGRTIVEKGADLFVHACAEALPALPGWRAVMLGARGHNPADDAIGYAAAGPTPARAGVQMLGYQPHPAVLEWMGRAAIVLMPSRWEEPFGLAALEALAMGAALICSRRGGLAEVAGEAAVYVDPDDPAGIARALLALARDPARRTALAAAGQARAVGFDVATAGRALEAIRRRVLGDPAPVRRFPRAHINSRNV